MYRHGHESETSSVQSGQEEITLQRRQEQPKYQDEHAPRMPRRGPGSRRKNLRRNLLPENFGSDLAGMGSFLIEPAGAAKRVYRKWFWVMPLIVIGIVFVGLTRPDTTTEPIS